MKTTTPEPSTRPPFDEDTENDPSSEARKPLIDLSATQLAGGALAAATAAYLGSRLGLAGTLTGAVIASLLTATASAVYTASLRRGREKVRAAVGRVRPADLAATPPVRTITPPRRSRQFPGWGRIGWRAVLVGTAAVFVTALSTITGVELLTGHALSGGGGTTVQQVGGDTSNHTKPTPKPTTTPSTTAGAFSTATTPAPSPTATVTVTATATPTAPPSPTPTPTTTGSEGAEPTPTQTTAGTSTGAASSSAGVVPTTG